MPRQSSVGCRLPVCARFIACASAILLLMQTTTQPRRGIDQVTALVGFLALAFVAAAIGGLSTTSGIASGWYDSLAKPAWTPPNWLFGPVWTLLYTLMGIAAWLVWRTAGSWGAARVPLGLFIIQLVLNAGWSAVFFGQRDPAGGLAVILLLLAAIVVTTWSFFRVNHVAGWLFVPYLIWVTYATTLNLGIVALAQ